jgi:hypothetical protein
MKKSLLMKIAGGALLIGATGCLKDKAAEEAGSEAEVNPRTALIAALNSQASNLVNGLNKVIIDGNFVKNVAVNNPPQPIPLGDDNEVNKAINYLLSNQIKEGESYSYTPDAKVCSEVMAKNNPAVCIEVMKKVSFKQFPANESEGALEIRIGAAKPVHLLYSSGGIAAQATLAELVKAAGIIDQVLKQNGDEGMQDPLPTTYAGAFQLTVSSFLSVSSLNFSITSPIDLRGAQQNGDTYSVQIPAAPNMLVAALDSVTGMGSASAALPAVNAEFTAHNDQDVAHQVQISFPGMAAGLSLDNALERISAQAALNSPDAYITVNGQPAAQLSSASQIDAYIQSYAGGHVSFNFVNEFSAQVEIFTNGLIEGEGVISGAIAAGSSLYHAFDSEQVKVISGSFQLSGTGSFLGSLDAQEDSCIEGQENSFPLQVVACE